MRMTKDARNLSVAIRQLKTTTSIKHHKHTDKISTTMEGELVWWDGILLNTIFEVLFQKEEDGVGRKYDG